MPSSSSSSSSSSSTSSSTSNSSSSSSSSSSESKPQGDPRAKKQDPKDKSESSPDKDGNPGLKDLEFGSLLSEDTHYGLVWKGYFRGLQKTAPRHSRRHSHPEGHDHRHPNHGGTERRPCVIKVVVLRSGVYYDQLKHKYQVGKSAKKAQKVPKKDKDKGKAESKPGGSQKALARHFEEDEAVPFVHSKFAKRKSMSLELFRHEAQSFQALSQQGMAPEVFACFAGRSNPSSPVRYGFLVVEQASCTLKDVLVRRNLKSAEERAARALIERLHKSGRTHGDCKPSNIVAWLDSHDRVKRVGFIDCMKIATRADSGSRRFERRKKSDGHRFDEHIQKNKSERGQAP